MLFKFENVLRQRIELALTTAPSKAAQNYNEGLIHILSLLDEEPKQAEE